jgi:folate-binding protein YgfZ
LDNAAYKLITETCGLCRLPHLSLVELTGADRKEWLQGQATNDLRKLEIGGSIETCICTPTGQLLANCTIWSLPDRFLIAVPIQAVEAFLRRVEMMVIMEDVEARHVQNIEWVSVQGPSSTEEVGKLLGTGDLGPGVVIVGGAEVTLLPTKWTQAGGWDFIFQKGTDAISSHFPAASTEAFDVARLEAGQPIFSGDMNEKTLPPEMGPAFEARNISYEKGCYTGQEVLMRIHSRGHTNRSWVGLLLESGVQRGDTISHASREDAGVITSRAYSPRLGFIGAAMLRNEAAVEGDVVTVNTKGGAVRAEVRNMPLTMERNPA